MVCGGERQRARRRRLGAPAAVPTGASGAGWPLPAVGSRGIVITNRAPVPVAGRSSATVPPCDSATARTMASPRPEPRVPVRTADEAVEHARPELGWNPRPVVLDGQNRHAVLHRGGRADVRAGGRVPGRVLDQVERQAMKVVAHTGHDRRLGVDRELVVLGHRTELGGRLEQHVGEVGRAAGHGSAGVGAREQQQVADEPAHPPGGAQRGLGSIGLLAVELLGEQLEVREQAGQRRAQLVRGVGDELPLALERGVGIGARGVERYRASPRRSGPAPRPRRRIRDGAGGAWGRGFARSRARPRSAARSGASRARRWRGRPAAPARCRRGRRAAGSPARARRCGRRRTGAGRRAATRCWAARSAAARRPGSPPRRRCPALVGAGTRAWPAGT